MATNRTVSTCSLASDGVTLTIPTAGGDGGNLNAQAAVTGVSVYVDGFRVKTNSIAASGSTQNIVATLKAKRISTETLTVDVVSSNFTDAGGNTVAAGQTGKSVTNGSTVAGTTATLAHNDSKILAGGSFGSITMGGRSVYSFEGDETVITIDFFGPQCEVLFYGWFAGLNLPMSVDGAAYANVSIDFQNIPVWTPVVGLTDAWHTLRVKGAYRGSNGLDTAGVAIRTLSATAPAFRRTSGYEGVVYSLQPTVNPSIVNKFTSNVDDLWTLASLFGPTPNNYLNGALAMLYPDTKLRWRGRYIAIKVHGELGAFQFVLLVDGVQVGGIQTHNAFDNPALCSAFGWQTVVSGLDNTAVHSYEIQIIYMGGTPTLVYWFNWLGVSTDGGDFDATAPASFPTDAVDGFGDSTWQITTGSLDTRDGFVSQFANMLGIRGINRSASGTTEHNFGGTAPQQYTTNSGEARVGTYVTPLHSKIVADGFGINDVGTLPPMGTTPTGAAAAITAASFQTSCENSWRNILTGKPDTILLVQGICEVSYGNNSADATYGVASGGNVNRLAFNTKRRAACVTMRGEFPLARVVYIDTDGVLIVTPGAYGTSSTDLFDGLHPRPSQTVGLYKIAVRFYKAYLASGGMAISTTGTPGVLSAAFATGGEAYAGETVTFTASVGTLTVTCAGATITGNGSGTVQVTFPTGTTSLTLAPSQSMTITQANGQGWLDHAPWSYVAASSVSSSRLISKGVFSF